MTETALVATERGSPIRRLDPEDAITQAKKWADALMGVVKATHISVNISGREYLKVEAWQTLARFNYCWIDTEWTRDIKDEEGRVLGVEARARLMSLDTGQSLGGAEGSCMMDEELETRDGQTVERWGDYYAVKSMAQTRAQGKVGRMAYAWVAVLAGYESTPAEEMTGVGRGKQTICPKCGKAAIIKGKAEYGGGWLCFTKKSGCGAKFSDGEWAMLHAEKPAQRPEEGPPLIESDVPLGADPAVPVSPVGQDSPNPADERAILLSKIKAAFDRKNVPAIRRKKIWNEYAKGAIADTVDIAVLHEILKFAMAL